MPDESTRVDWTTALEHAQDLVRTALKKAQSTTTRVPLPCHMPDADSTPNPSPGLTTPPTHLTMQVADQQRLAQ